MRESHHGCLHEGGPSMQPKRRLTSTLPHPKPNPGRRRVLVGASACAATLMLPEAFAQAGSCTITPDSGEGPFYFDPNLVRSDLASGQVGAPLAFSMQITRARDCAPLP